MSVLKSHRKHSKAEYINNANFIYTFVIAILTRLSAKYSRIFTENTIQLASKLIDECEMANSIYPSDKSRFEMRKKHLLEARAALMALDVKLYNIYKVLRLNPVGCFVSSRNKALSKDKAEHKLGKMAERLGFAIDRENECLTNLLKSDKCRFESGEFKQKQSPSADELLDLNTQPFTE